jgi:branched-chain amino acid transport system substrate-binding protein
MTRKSKVVPAALLALVAAVVLAACGSSSSSSTSGSTSAAADTSAGSSAAKAPTGDPIKIGAIGSLTAIQTKAALGSLPEVIKAWEQDVNNSGGLNGHPVQVSIVDDVADPAKATAGIKKLVEQDHVMAIVPDASQQDTVFQKYLEQKGIPVLGGTPFQAPHSTSADWFPVGGPLTVMTYGFLKKAVDQGKTKFSVLYCAESPVCGGAAKLVDSILKTVIKKGSLVYSGKIAGAAPNYNAQCIAAKQAGVDAIWTAQAPDINARVVANCNQQGFKPVQLNCCGSVGPVTNNWGGDGAIFVQPNAPITSQGNAGIDNFNAVLKKYAPDLVPSNGQYNDQLVSNWAGLELFRKVAETAKLTPTSTPDDVKAGLYALKDETLDGLTVPLNYVKSKPTVLHCWFNQTVTGGGNVGGNGTTPECVPGADEAALAPLGG